MWVPCQDGRVTESIHPTTTAGWREWVGLPDLQVEWIKAKLDTGARSSSLHATDVELIPGSPDRVRFRVLPWQATDDDAVAYECPVHDRRIVRSSSGHSEERYTVLLDVVLMGRRVAAEVTLSSRDEMGFRMLIGREVLRRGFLVDAARSFAGGRAPRDVRRRNRGRG
ncbi:MAG: ATP-dependent zinc protease [Microbacterium sp.]|uniref:ATP-dependent zinc protease family protein n=1 Tax=Microbacterium sp. TaxID=51671 RepID=UPI003A853C49